MKKEKIKLNLGCASRLLPDYINVDIDSLDEIKKRYSNLEIEDSYEFLQSDILNLPFDDNSVDEIRADAILEHLSFLEESQFFKEASRVLKPDGVLNFSVPDFEDTVRKWIDAEDDWRDFYRNDDEAIKQNHWFGHYSYSAESRWGWLITCIFGPQNGLGQFHKNAYTESKIRSMCKKINFKIVSLDRFLWKGDRDLMIRAVMSKK